MSVVFIQIGVYERIAEGERGQCICKMDYSDGLWAPSEVKGVGTEEQR